MAEMTIKPLGDLLLVRLFERVNKTASGLVFKEAWESPRNKAEILAVGPDVNKDIQSTEIMLSPGKTIVVNPYALIDMSEKVVGGKSDEKYLIKQKDVLALWV